MRRRRAPATHAQATLALAGPPLVLVWVALSLAQVVVAGSGRVDPRDLVDEVFRSNWRAKPQFIAALGDHGDPELAWVVEEVWRQFDEGAASDLQATEQGRVLTALARARVQLGYRAAASREGARAYLRGVLTEQLAPGTPRPFSGSDWAAEKLAGFGDAGELPLIIEYLTFRWQAGVNLETAVARAEERVALAARGEEGYAEALRSDERWKRNWAASELRAGDPALARRVLRGLLSELAESVRALVARDGSREEFFALRARWSGPYTTAYRTATELGCLESETEFSFPHFFELH